MKKIILVVLLIGSLFIYNTRKEDYYVVPKESIRFRIIPNSNTAYDLFMKEQVKNEITDVISEIEKTTDIASTRQKIIDSIPLLNDKITTLFNKNNYNETFKINYGLNYFPEKIYKGVKYESGEYESMVIEIGKKEGDNYWCVLFPPLCLIEAEESSDVEYSFFIKELFEKFKNQNKLYIKSL